MSHGMPQEHPHRGPGGHRHPWHPEELGVQAGLLLLLLLLLLLNKYSLSMYAHDVLQQAAKTLSRPVAADGRLWV